MSLKLITPATTPPLHLNAIKKHLRVDGNEEDDIIAIYLAEAIGGAYNITQRQLVAARWRYDLDSFPCEIDVPLGPLVQVVSINYTDANGLPQTVPTTDYETDHSDGSWTHIVHAIDKAWPATKDMKNAVRIVLDAGYVAPLEANSTDDTIKLTGWKDLAVNDVVRLSNSGGELPKPLKPATDYYVQSISSPGVYKLAISASGTAIDLTDNGAGLNFAGQLGLNDSLGEIPGGFLSWLLLTVETRYSYRGGLINTPGSIISKNPFIDCILDPYKVAVV